MSLTPQAKTLPSVSSLPGIAAECQRRPCVAFSMKPWRESGSSTFDPIGKFEFPFDARVFVEWRHLILEGTHRFRFSETYRQYLREMLVPFVKHKKIRIMPV